MTMEFEYNMFSLELSSKRDYPNSFDSYYTAEGNSSSLERMLGKFLADHTDAKRIITRGLIHALVELDELDPLDAEELLAGEEESFLDLVEMWGN